LLEPSSRRPGWSQLHVLAVASAPLVVVAAEAYAVPTYAPASAVSAIVGDLAITVVLAIVLYLAFRRAIALASTPAEPLSTPRASD
jgi:F0F1-type ATP synthase assembly protein I